MPAAADPKHMFEATAAPQHEQMLGAAGEMLGLAREAGGAVAALAAGHRLAELTSELGAADTVVLCQHESLAAFSPEAHQHALAAVLGARGAATLPKKMYESIRLESDPVIAVVSTLLVSAVVLGVLISVFMRGRPVHAP